LVRQIQPGQYCNLYAKFWAICKDTKVIFFHPFVYTRTCAPKPRTHATHTPSIPYLLANPTKHRRKQQSTLVSSYEVPPTVLCSFHTSGRHHPNIQIYSTAQITKKLQSFFLNCLCFAQLLFCDPFCIFTCVPSAWCMFIRE
jgi:hypothetical protein